MVYSYCYISSGTLKWTSHRNDELCVIVGLRLAVHSAKYWHKIPSIYASIISLLNHLVALIKAVFMCHWCISIFWPALALQHLFAAFWHWVNQLDEVVMSDNTVPGGDERLDQLSLVSLMPERLCSWRLNASKNWQSSLCKYSMILLWSMVTYHRT